MPKTLEELEKENQELLDKIKELGDPDKKFTQKQVDDILGNRLKKQKEEQEKLVAQLEDFKKNKSLNDNQRQELQTQIDDLQSTLLTKEEIAAKEKASVEKKYKKDLDDAVEKAKIWQGRYTESTIERSILDAATKEKVINPSQIVQILRPSTRLVEVDDALIPQAKIQSVDKDGKPVILDLPIPEAIKQMKELPEHGNLFQAGTTGGTGSNTLHPGTGEGKIDLTNTEKYIEARKKGLTLDKIGK